MSGVEARFGRTAARAPMADGSAVRLLASWVVIGIRSTGRLGAGAKPSCRQTQTE